jgi:hypothetical protein
MKQIHEDNGQIPVCVSSGNPFMEISNELRMRTRK